MTKFLEVTINDDGKMCFSSEWIETVPIEKADTDIKVQREVDKMIKTALEGLARCLWEEGNRKIYPLIRILSIGEMLSCQNPDAQVEEFWHTMSFSIIPELEKYADKVKSHYGVRLPEGMEKAFKWIDPDFKFKFS